MQTEYDLDSLLELVRVPTCSDKKNRLNYACDGCGQDLTSYPIWLNEIIREFTVCDKCYSGGKLSENSLDPCHSCDYKKWKMFEEVKTKCKLDIREGWYRRQDADEDLCLYHGDMLMKTDDKWKSVFLKFKPEDTFHKIDLDTEIFLAESGAMFPAHRIKNLVLPDSIDRIVLVRALKEWLGLEILDSSDRTLGVTWVDIESVNGNTSDFYLIDKYLTTIAEWVPFEWFPVHETSSCCFALVNCNPESRYFHTVATVLRESHGPAWFNMSFKLFDSKRDSLTRMDLDSTLTNLINLYIEKNYILTYTEYMEGRNKYHPKPDPDGREKNYVEHIRTELRQ
jgi:acyl carrier protein